MNEKLKTENLLEREILFRGINKFTKLNFDKSEIIGNIHNNPQNLIK